MLTRPLLVLALLSSKPFVVCAPQAMHADEATASTTSDTTTTSTTTTETSSSTSIDPTESTTTTDPSTSTGPAMCGNGVQEAGEACDDGNNADDDACLSDCSLASCGDSHVFAGEEECDDGDKSNTNACTDGCKMAFCGDGFVWDTVEECDDGNDENTDSCTNDCTIPICGDGAVQGTEECDNGPDNADPNSAPFDGCTTNCKWACGDGTKSSGEECDDGNNKAGDGCASNCFHEYVMFATTQAFPADFGGIGDGDAICQGAALGSGLKGNYVAWLSAGVDSASTDLPAGKPLVRTDGELIVAAAEDLIQGPSTKLLNPINRDEDGNEVTGYAWTGTGTAGGFTGSDCTSWTAANAAASTIGSLTSTTQTWTNEPLPDPFTQIQCNALNHLYCVRTLAP